MEEGRLNKLLQNIEDFVFIEEKIVTCVWLCQVLKIHVNTAKQLLHAFLQGDAVADKVLVTYLIGGDLKDGRGKQIKLVEDGVRESTKSLFSRLTTDHIYSIQKSGNGLKPVDLFNSHPHFLVNSDGPRFSTVQPSKEIEKREVKVPVVMVQKDIPLKTSKPVKPEEKNVDKQKANNAEEPPSKQKKASPEKNSKQPANKAKSQGIAGMFNRQAEKKKVESPSDKPEVKEVKKKTSGISGFFQKQPAKKESPEPESMETDSDLPIKETNNKVEQKQKNIQVNKEEKAKQTESENNKLTMKDKKFKGKENRKKRKKRDEEKEDESRKKRKRIVSLLSSDSESSGEGESECEMEVEAPPAVTEPAPEEEEDIIPPTPGRKRVRKQIDKTYTDEDGFILTKKEYVYESCTDDEGSEEKNEKEKEAKVETKSSPVVKNEDKKTSSKKSPPTKHISPNNSKANKQQPSIMNFFKRK